jgi:hypothetical protein
MINTLIDRQEILQLLCLAFEQRLMRLRIGTKKVEGGMKKKDYRDSLNI